MTPPSPTGDFLQVHSAPDRAAAAAFLSAHLAHSPLGVIHWDDQFRITLWSGRAAEILGWTHEDVAGKTMLEFPLVHADDIARVVDARRQLFSGELLSNRSINRNYTKDGRVIHCQWFNSYVRTGTSFSVLSLVEDITEQQQTQAQLLHNEQSFRALFDNNPDSVCSIDMQGRILAANRAALALTGYSEDELIGSGFQRLFPAGELARAYARFAELLSGVGATYEMTIVRKNGSLLPITSTTTPIILDGKVSGAFAVSKDISERHASDTLLHAQRDQIRKLCVVATMPADIPEKHIDATLRLGLELLGLDVAAVYSNDDIPRTLKFIVVSNAGGSLRLPEALVQAAGSDAAAYDSLPGADGIDEPRTFIGGPIDIGSSRYGVVCFAGARERPDAYSTMDRDLVSLMCALIGSAIERGQSHRRLNTLAFTDSLTGLPNRTLFHDRLEQSLASALRNRERVALVFLDLDHFKDINDSLGHAVGDQLLQAVGERLRRCLRQSDTVARMGGDEFIMLLPNIGDEGDAVTLAQKILEALAEPFFLDGHEQYSTASIGVSIFPDDGDDAQTLVKNADIAMYRAKDRGRNGYTFFTHELNAQVASRVAFETRLRRAVQRDEFCVHYQPIIALPLGRLASVEALLRWEDPELGLIYPERFIASLEHTGLIIPLGMAVLRTASRQLSEWHDAGFSGLRLAVNLSARQLHNPNLATEIMNVLSATGLDPRYLELEITETVAMSDVNLSIQVLRALKSLGVSMSVDDFGTGYSSLAYLRRFPIDKLKIDRSFIAGLGSDQDDATIVSTVVGMAHSLHLGVIAEGVETQEQFDFLRELECDEVQGHLFSAALSPEDFAQKIAGWVCPA